MQWVVGVIAGLAFVALLMGAVLGTPGGAQQVGNGGADGGASLAPRSASQIPPIHQGRASAEAGQLWGPSPQWWYDAMPRRCDAPSFFAAPAPWPPAC